MKLKIKKRTPKNLRKLIKVVQKQEKLLVKMLKKAKESNKNSERGVIFESALNNLNKELEKLKDGLGALSSNQVQYIAAS